MTVIVNGDTGITYPNSTTQASAGVVLQVVNAIYSTPASSTSSSYADTGLTASITPKFSTSKILCMVNINGLAVSATVTSITLNIVRNSTQLIEFEKEALYFGAVTTQASVGGSGATYLDSPATTSATTYKVQAKRTTGSATVYWAASNSTCTITLMEIAA